MRNLEKRVGGNCSSRFVFSGEGGSILLYCSIFTCKMARIVAKGFFFAVAPVRKKKKNEMEGSVWSPLLAYLNIVFSIHRRCFLAKKYKIYTVCVW